MSVAAQPQVPIGLIAPVTGASDYIGKVVVNGVRLAVEKFTESVPQISLVNPFDDKGQPEVARQGFESLEKQRCVAIVGPVDSSCAAEIAVLARDKHLVAVSPAATASYLVDKSNEWFFRVHSSDKHRTDTLAILLSERHPTACVLVMHEGRKETGSSEPLLYGEQQALDLTRALSKTGLRLTEAAPFFRESSPDELKDLISKLRVKWSDVNVVVLLGLSREVLKVVKALREFKDARRKPVYLISPNRDQFTAARLRGPIYAVTDTVHEIASYKPFEDFKAAYRFRFPGADFTEYAGFAYDATNIVLDAVASAYLKSPEALTGDLNAIRQSVRNQIASTPHSRHGVITQGSFSPEHELNLQPLIIDLHGRHWRVTGSLPPEAGPDASSHDLDGRITDLEQSSVVRVIKIVGPAAGVIAAVSGIFVFLMKHFFP